MGRGIGILLVFISIKHNIFGEKVPAWKKRTKEPINIES